ncbi:hypothetical protein Dsin_018857 [Dipteronia sinensis]|uniref:Anaphase-promoting complex subunit 4 WD40 domain-containing protein n=1 Tax=Dipteronia sinensis TaxID=43782 RepID=A0AAE0A7L6_9ROSI|nr:hypothetical protein Dsin_018857 [Dipteronia sinensis]
MDDYHLNQLDWGSSNVLAIALVSKVHLWDASDASISGENDTGVENDPVTSVSWDPVGLHIAIGLNNSQLRNLRGGHRSRVSSLAWNNNQILTTGGMDGYVINNDVRVRETVVGTYIGHSHEANLLATGGDGDGCVKFWNTHTGACLNSIDTAIPALKSVLCCGTTMRGSFLAIMVDLLRISSLYATDDDQTQPGKKQK